MYQILFVHQDPKLRQIYEPHLASHFSLDSASDGMSALRKIKRNLPDAVVSDYSLPIISGVSLLRFIRSQNELSHLPFIFLTAYPEIDNGLNLGANDWISLHEATPSVLIDRIYNQLKLNRYVG